MVIEVDQPEIGPVRLLGHPVKLSRTPADPSRPAPALGEHTEQVLAEAGLKADAIARLLASGAVAGPDPGSERTASASEKTGSAR